MSLDPPKFLFVVQHQDELFDLMPYSIARTWVEDKGCDLAIYLMYHAVELVRKDKIAERPDIKEAIDCLFSKGVPIYVCGFCTRACELSQDKYYPGIVVANRNIYYSLFSERRAVYY
ncbi:MAG TPA: DsrE family protein [Anaerolineaceae bacterium]|nr:DsrE family protein [Anaerolineaceae bacterium]